MVYAVAMTTIRHFEQALGRKALWAPRNPSAAGRERGEEEYVERLRIYPHALREANAYYSPQKRALLFGYFPASSDLPGRNLPGGTVFTCLSHDIVAHETTHALLDGMHHRFIESSNADVLAFHEAFADIVALFQHFGFPGVLRHQIAHTCGDLASQNLLGQLAQQFGEAVGHYGALRDALGQVDPTTKRWEPSRADPSAYGTEREPHARGSILVAAVFDAFLAIYRSRIADLLRIATGGSGVLPAGQLHPDLVERLAQEASKSARHVLTMCIRALDYCPPVDLTFGEYLRALITADTEVVPDDDLKYRVAMIEAFRRRGLYPSGIRSLAPDSLLWRGPEEFPGGSDILRLCKLRNKQLRVQLKKWNLSANRKTMFDNARSLRTELRNWFEAVRDDSDSCEIDSLEAMTGLALTDKAPKGLSRGPDGKPKFEVHVVWPSLRIGPDGWLKLNLVVELTQQRKGFRCPDQQKRFDQGQEPRYKSEDFMFRGGCTIVLDLEKALPCYFIHKGILTPSRLQRQREWLVNSESTWLRAAYFGATDHPEPFAMLHRDA
jgi:hypothetical protein